MNTANATIESLTTLNRQQAAELLGIGVRTLDRMVAEGTIPTTKFRGRRVFNREVLVRWAAAQCQGGCVA